MEVEGTEAFKLRFKGDTEKKVTKAMNSPYGVVLPEEINEDGHTDVASSKRKVMIMVDDSNKLLNKLNGMNKEDSLPSWWSDKITLSQNYLEKATNYLLNPVESVNENILTKQLSKMINEPESSIVKFMKKTGYDEATLLDFVEKLTRNNSRLRKIHTTILKNAIKGDKKSEKSIEKTLYGESINESKEPEVITQLRDIVKRKSSKKIKDPKTKKNVRVDMFSANVITQVYDAIKKNSSHRNKFESLPLDKMAQLSFKMMKR